MGNSVDLYSYRGWDVRTRNIEVKAVPDKYRFGSFDPMYGFSNGRKEREMVATVKEMEDANVPLDKRDFCAHLYIAWKKCFYENHPWTAAKCKHEAHEYQHCQQEDYLLRRKEYERERRLYERQQRKLKANPEKLIEGNAA